MIASGPLPVAGPLQALLAAADGWKLSTSRRRQLAWVARELTAYAAALPSADRPSSTRAWLARDLVAGYLAAADSGELRSRTSTHQASPDSTRRVRRACLRLLAAAASVPDPVGDQVPLPTLRPHVEPSQAAIALSQWKGLAAGENARPHHVRAAAIAALTHEVGLRSGEHAHLLVDDYDPDTGVLTYQPRPPATRVPPAPVTVTVSEGTRALLGRWLRIRSDLTLDTPRTRHLWVSLRANHDGAGVRRPAGLALRPTGLRRAHARAVAEVNFQLAGSPGWEPLPRTPGVLRRYADEPGSSGVRDT